MTKVPCRTRCCGGFASTSHATIARLIALLLPFAAALPLAGGCCTLRDKKTLHAGGAWPIGRWTLGPQEGTCHIAFSFPPPHDDYSGEVRTATGWVEVSATGHMCGSFAVRAADVEMGEPDLTENVRFAAEMLHGEAFPEITFDFEDADLSDGPRAAHAVVLDGTFRLKGEAIPLSAAAQLKFIPQRSGIDLHLQGTFELHDLRRRFDISGPGGDGDPAGNTLLFTFEFLLTKAGI